MNRRTSSSQNKINLLKQDIEAIIERDIRPVLRLHHGDIKIIDVGEDSVKLVFTGACKTCPSAQITANDVIRDALKNTVKNISMVTETDEELLNFAKLILQKKVEL